MCICSWEMKIITKIATQKIVVLLYMGIWFMMIISTGGTRAQPFASYIVPSVKTHELVLLWWAFCTSLSPSLSFALSILLFILLKKEKYIFLSFSFLFVFCWRRPAKTIWNRGLHTCWHHNMICALLFDLFVQLFHS